MGSQTYADPTKIKPMPGKLVVEITEILGGKTKGGVHLPINYQDHMGKDTFYGKVLRVGPPPALAHYKSGPGPGLDVRSNKHGNVWPDSMMEPFKVGNIILFPRDVPLSFVWKGKRYAICYIHEAIISIDKDDFDPKEFQVVPWIPDPIP